MQHLVLVMINTLFLVMITTLRWWNTLSHEIPKVRVRRERQIQIGKHFFFGKNVFFSQKKIVPPKNKNKKIKKMPC